MSKIGDLFVDAIGIDSADGVPGIVEGVTGTRNGACRVKLAACESLNVGRMLGAGTLGNLRSFGWLGTPVSGGESVGGATVGGATVGGATVGGATVGGATVGGATIGGATIGGCVCRCGIGAFFNTVGDCALQLLINTEVKSGIRARMINDRFIILSWLFKGFHRTNLASEPMSQMRKGWT